MLIVGFIKLINSLLSRAVVILIDFYRNFLSCLMLPRCRFYPSCSCYAREAFAKKGFTRGLVLTIRRLLRCHPFDHSFFYDPLN
ncbi:MAG: membrane protein insertion efficiency factor YidD [Candidatus Omnitrophota bacterium]